VDKLAKIAATRDLIVADVMPLTKVTTPLFKIVASYQNKVKALGGPAAKELGGMLAALEVEFKGWDKLMASLPSAQLKTFTPEQREAAAAIVIPLEKIRGQCENVESRAPRAAEYFRSNGPVFLATVAQELLDKAEVLRPESIQVWRAAISAAKGKNYQLFKSRAQTFETRMDQFAEVAEEYATGVDKKNLDSVDAKALKEYCKLMPDVINEVRRALAALP
jgi:hypothetical protein